MSASTSLHLFQFYQSTLFVPTTPITFSSAKVKHQTLSRERHATAAHVTTSKAVPNDVAGKSGLRTVEFDPLPRCKRLLGR
jgi:hypothetical protein